MQRSLLDKQHIRNIPQTIPTKKAIELLLGTMGDRKTRIGPQRRRKIGLIKSFKNNPSIQNESYSKKITRNLGRSGSLTKKEFLKLIDEVKGRQGFEVTFTGRKDFRKQISELGKPEKKEPEIQHTDQTKEVKTKKTEVKKTIIKQQTSNQNSEFIQNQLQNRNATTSISHVSNSLPNIKLQPNIKLPKK